MPIHLIDNAKNSLREREYNQCFEIINEMIEGLKLNEKEYYDFILKQIAYLKKRYELSVEAEGTSQVFLGKMSNALEAFLSLVWYKEEDEKTRNRKVTKTLKVIIVTDDMTYFWEEIAKIIHVLNEYTNNSIRSYKRLFKTDKHSYIGIEIKRDGALIMQFKSIAKLKIIPFISDMQVLDSYLDDFYKAMNELYINLENIDLSKSVDIMKFYWIEISENRNHKYRFGGFDLSWANFSNANLCGIDFSSANLSNANFNNSKLKNIDFRGTNLWNATLQNANFHSTRFSKSNLQNANLSEAKLASANFEQANLREANLTKTNLDRANLEAAICICTNFSQSNLQRAKFKKADLYGADFTESDLTSTKLSIVSCHEVDFSKAYFSFTDFSNSDCTGAKFIDVKLYKVNFSQTKLHKASFLKTNIVATTFKKAILAKTVFSEDQKTNLKKQEISLSKCLFKDDDTLT